MATGSLEDHNRICVLQRRQLLEAEQEWLRSENPDIIVSDIVPLACAAASGARIPCICVSNFSWDFVYSEYLTTVPAALRNVTWQIAADYAKADLLLRLPGYCPMPAFKEVVDVPLVVRHARLSVRKVQFRLSQGP